jgi:hypothetical protein
MNIHTSTSVTGLLLCLAGLHFDVPHLFEIGLWVVLIGVTIEVITQIKLMWRF